MRRLDEHRLGPAIALTDATTELFASGFMMAWADTDPRSRMGGIGEVAHIPAKFTEQHFNTAAGEARDRIDPLNEGIMRA